MSCTTSLFLGASGINILDSGDIFNYRGAIHNAGPRGSMGPQLELIPAGFQREKLTEADSLLGAEYKESSPLCTCVCVRVQTFLHAAFEAEPL